MINSRYYGARSMNYSGPSLPPITNCTINYVTSNSERKKKQKEKETPKPSELEERIACSEDEDFINSIISNGGTILDVGENVEQIVQVTHEIPEQAVTVEIKELSETDRLSQKALKSLGKFLDYRSTCAIACLAGQHVRQC